MSDERLRALERRWRETGAAEDGAAWLGARVRAGVLSEEGLRLAAHLGDPGARLALGEAEAAPDGWELLRGLADFGWELQLRACLIAAQAVQPVWEREHPGDLAYREVLAAGEVYLADPSPARAATLAATADALPTPAPISRPANRVALAAATCGRVLGLPEPRRAGALTDALRYAHMTAPAGGLAEALRATLLPQILDPVPPA